MRLDTLDREERRTDASSEDLTGVNTNTSHVTQGYTQGVLQANYLNSGRLLTEDQLKRLTDLLNKMFVDAHTKVFSLLLDAVCELLLVHWQQLRDWLYQLMFR